MLKESTLFDGEIDKVQLAISRIRLHEPKDGYYVAFSGGKDSVVVLDLVKRAGVKYDVHHNITNVEPPELIYFIKEKYPEVINELPKKTMWQLIEEHGMPPTRLMRFCCQELKEHGGEGRFKVTGVRHEESLKRSKRQFLEPCARNTGTRFLNPIIEWTEQEVWEYIKTFNVPYCDLYDKGRKRIGCLFCPYGGGGQMQKDAELYPKFKNQFIKTFDRMIKKRIEKGLKTDWKDSSECFNWWVGNTTKEDSTQITFGFEKLNFV